MWLKLSERWRENKNKDTLYCNIKIIIINKYDKKPNKTVKPNYKN